MIQDTEDLQNTYLPENLASILDASYSNQASNTNQLPSPLLVPFSKRPRPSQLKERLAPRLVELDAGSLIQGAVRAADAAWDAYTDGSVAPTDFLRTPIGALYRVKTIPGKGRGMVASRDLAAGETVLLESPLALLVKERLDLLSFFVLPKPAIHSMLLLHNNIPNNREFSLNIDIPQHRLLDYLKGVCTSNAFSLEVDTDGTVAGIIVLAGSLFNHSNERNVVQTFDIPAFRMVFKTLSAVKEGQELTINYGVTNQHLRDNYGISA
ncbi:hypothetical protein B0H11DRAFT_1351991 [Mycena galericulata]|nr:hypothetical protein B0H11DRAFT_1351991 [Mycena galericulata]